MLDHLTGDVRSADFLVDLSNLVRNRDLHGRPCGSLVRLERLLDALADREKDPEVQVYLVADTSLFARDLLPKLERRDLIAWRRAGLVDTVDDADERLLELAEATGLPLITSDRFRGHRIEYAWLQGNVHQFFEPHVEADGRMTVRRVDMGTVTEWQISRSAEQDQLKKQGLLMGPRRRPRYDILERMWRCPDERCTLYDARRGTRVLLPRLRQGVPTCSLHALELADDGPRPPTVQLKLLLDGECVERFTCRADTEVPVGRAPSAGIGLEPWLSRKERTLVSRHHFTLVLKNGILRVRDHSTNGTKILTGDGEKIRLVSGREYAVRPSDRIMCAPRVALARSGRKFPAELAVDYSRVMPKGERTPTTRVDSDSPE